MLECINFSRNIHHLGGKVELLSDKRAIILLTAPGLIIFIYAVLFPAVLSIYLGMNEWPGFGKMTFVGWMNYKEVLTDKSFWGSLQHAFTLGICTVLIQHPIALGCAFLLDYVGGRLERVFKSILFIPCIISVVVTAKMWVNLLNAEFGLVNKFLGVIGLPMLKRYWLGDPKLSLYTVVFVVMWCGFGWAMLVYYSGVKSLPKDVFEAARIDGANWFLLLIRILLPILKPVIVMAMIFGMVSALKQMEVVLLTTNGGPGSSSQFLANYLYSTAFTSARYGYGNAISVYFVAICMLVAVVMSKIAGVISKNLS